MTQPATLITQWADTLTAPVTLELIVSTKSTQADEMAKFARLLSEAAGGKIELRETKGDDVLPSLVTPGGITFHTLPGTKQLPFFLAALSKTPPTLPASVQKMAEGLTLPVVLDLFIAESCPFCPQITGQLIALATANTLVSLRIFDGTLFPEEAARQNIMSAPTLIYDNQLRWSGQFDLASAMEMMVGRPPQELSAAALRGMLEEGEASRVAAMMAKTGCAFKGLNELLAHEKWSVRLGAMVVMEELAETHPAIVSETATLLLDASETLNPSALGDIIYIAGLSGDPNHIGRLEALKALSDDEELRETIDEAVEAILESSGEA